MLQKESLEQFHRILEPDGEIHLVTDHAELWAWYEELVGANQQLFSREEFSPPQSAQEGEFVGTNFERKYQAEKRSVSAMTLRRLG